MTDSVFDRARLVEAFDRLGADLAARGAFVEIAVYGGGALMLQFEWRQGTDDVDAVVRIGHDERVLKPSVEAVAADLGLRPDWLNDAVGMFTPLDEPDDLFEASGTYPAGPTPGLRVLTARPLYLLAMKLQALANIERGDRDLEDAKALAAHLGIADEAALETLYVSIFDEPPPRAAASRFGRVLGDRS